jgi:protein TonB
VAAGGPAFSGAARAAAAGVGNPLPRYPFAARRKGLEGRVVIRVRVSPRGQAAEVAVLESSGHRLLDDAAERTLADWRFVPALRRGRAVESVVDVPVTFRLED